MGNLKKYWHELTDEEYNAIPGRTLFSTVRKRYKQPEWCNYPDAIGGMGCWSLIDKDLRKKINREFCRKCDCSTDYERPTVDWQSDADEDIIRETGI